MKITRTRAIIGVSAVAVAVLIVVGTMQMFPRLFDPYAGLKTTLDVQMSDATRALVQQKLETTKASIAASEKAGQKVDMGLYLTIAEQYYILGDLVSARETYEAYLELNPISYVAWNSYASVLEFMEDYDAAGPAFQKAIEGLKTEEYYRDYADFLAAHYPEKESEYKAVLDSAFEQLGQTSWTMQALGDWYFSQHDCRLGRDHYEVAQKLSPENPNIQTDGEEQYNECMK